jgi:hypothetical protein
MASSTAAVHRQGIGLIWLRELKYEPHAGDGGLTEDIVLTQIAKIACNMRNRMIV